MSISDEKNIVTSQKPLILNSKEKNANELVMVHFTVLKLSWNKNCIRKTYLFTISNVTLAAEIFLPLLFSISTWMGIPSPGTKPIVSKYSVAEIGPDLQQRQHRVMSLLASADCCKVTKILLCVICVTFLFISQCIQTKTINLVNTPPPPNKKSQQNKKTNNVPANVGRCSGQDGESQ